VFVVRFRIGAGMVDNTITMIRGRIEGIELHWNTSGIDDVVICPTRDEHGESRADHRANSIENGLARPFLHAKELIGFVRSIPISSLGFNAMTTSWQFLAVYSTWRKSSFLTVMPSMFCTKPFIVTPPVDDFNFVFS
jgi:hypothetical protein